MAGTPITVDGLAFDVVKIVGKLQSLGFCLDLDICSKDPEDLTIEDLSKAFNRIFSLFWTEIYSEQDVWQPPVILVNGMLVDLFMVFLVVRSKGGYVFMSRNRLWASLAEEIGLDPAAGTALKLIYVKYLDAMDGWFHEALNEGITPSQEKDFACTPSLSGSTHSVNLNNEALSRKRKRVHVSDMLNWVKTVAKKPRKQILRREKHHGHDIGELFSQAFSCRDLLFIKMNRRTKEPSEQEFPEIHLDYLMEKSLMVDNVLERLFRITNKKKIRLGYRTCQAKVPQWTGRPSKTIDTSDIKWLGTQIYLPKSEVNRPPYEHQLIGKGRQEGCRCALPNSVECVRFHVAENRFQLKREYTSTFDSGRFNQMGEEVALSWTEEEQRSFKSIVHKNPPSEEKFWETLCSYFPEKRMKDLVRYYFNVFIIARRSYQNRVIPKQIDTDDDETEYDFLCLPYGHDAFRSQN